MFPAFWTSDLVIRRMLVQLCRMAFLDKIYSPRGVNFCHPISKSSMGTLLFYFISWVYMYWITSVQTFTKIWVQVLFGLNDLNLFSSIKLHWLVFGTLSARNIRAWSFRVHYGTANQRSFQFVFCQISFPPFSFPSPLFFVLEQPKRDLGTRSPACQKLPLVTASFQHVKLC